MGNLFIRIYNFFKRHIIVLIFLLIAIIGFEAYSIYTAKYSEDITDLLPNEQSMSGLSDVMKNSKLADQIIIHFAFSDTTVTAPDTLIQIASAFVDTLTQDTTLDLINIKFKIDDNEKLQAYQFFYDNLHLYLDADNYNLIRNKLTTENIEQTLSRNLQELTSPSGIITKQFILQDPLSLTPLVIDRLNNFKVDENYLMYKSCIFSQDKKHLLIFIEPGHSASDIKNNEILLNRIDEIKQQFKTKHTKVEIDSYGGPIVALGNSKRVKKDVALTVSIALLLLVILFLLVFRNLHVFNLLFLPIILGSGLAFSVLSFITPTISVLSLGVGAILMGIAIDYSLHLFTHYRSSGNIKTTFKDVVEPILISCLTTSLTFLCLFVVQSDVLTELGIFVAISIFFTMLFVLIGIPQYLRFINLDKIKIRKNTIFDKASKIDLSNNKYLVYSIIALSILFAFTSQRLSFNGDISTLNYLTDDVRKIETTLTKISPDVLSSVTIVSEGATLDDALKNLETIAPIINELKQADKVKSYVTVNEIMLSDQKQKEKLDQWNKFWNSVDTSLLHSNFITIGKKYHFKEKTFTPFFNKINIENTAPDFSVMRKLLLDNYISVAEDGTYRVFSIVKIAPKYKSELFDLIKNKNGIRIFDKAYYTDMFFKILKTNFNLLVTVSMLLVFLILWIAFGRIELAVIAYLPIIISWLWTIGMMGLFNIQFNIFSIIITTFVFGLGIDYSIFLLRGLLNNYKYGNKDISPYRMSIILSVCTTIAGVGVLILAQHPALKSIALVSIFGIVSVVFVTFVLLPRLFNFLIVSGGKKRTSPVVMLDIFVSVGSFFIFLIFTIILTLSLPIFIIFPLSKVNKKNIFSHILYFFSKLIVIINFTIKRKYVNKSKLDLSTPKVIVSNHQSHLDLVLILMLNPKIVVLTNKWVWNNPFYGFIIRYAGFYSVIDGVEQGIEKLKSKVQEGYSVLVFPEGTRTIDGKIKRFHQGAFTLANELNIPIQPILIHGAYECLPKTEFFLHSGTIILKFFDSINVVKKDISKQETYRIEAKKLTKFFRTEFEKIKEKECDTHSYKQPLISKYIYKGPILEWYLRIKIRIEKDYELFESLLPKSGKIVDIGCGYGFLGIMLKLTGKSRDILGLDYDDDKISVAQNITNDFANISFKTKDILKTELPKSDAFILSDVLHYMPYDMQKNVLQRCIDSLNHGGIIIVRDANADYQKRTKGTKLTELFSTKIFKFNKTNYALEFSSADMILKLGKKNNMSIEVIDTTKYTSNIIHLLRKEYE